MSQVFWCDYGNHAAKLTEQTVTVSKPGKKVNITDQFGTHVGQTAGETIQVCEECAVEMGFSNDYTAVDPIDRHKAIETTVRNGK